MNRRLVIMGVLAAVTLAAYAGLRHFSPVLVAYVVEETLVQKAPDGADRSEIRKSFRIWLGASPDDAGRVGRLFVLSRQLERVQKLSELELNQLLKNEAGSPQIR